MVSVAAKTSLVLCIIEAVASGSVGSVAFPDTTRNQQFIPSALLQHSAAIGSQVFKWSEVTNGCIPGKTDFSLTGIPSLDICASHCRVQTTFLCKSVEYNTRGGRCLLSSFNSRTPNSNYADPCPTEDIGWVYAELIDVPQRPAQNDIQSTVPVRDRFQELGQTPPQQNGVRPPNPATVRPSVTNPNQQVSHTAQQSGLPSTQQGKPQNQQNGANQVNAASSGLDHFTSATHRPAPQSTSHNGNQQQQQHQQTQQQQQQQPQHQQNQHQQQPQHQQTQNQQTQHQQTNPQQNQQTQHQQTQHHQSQVPGAATGATSGPPGTSGATSGSGQKKPDRCHRIPSPGECRGAFPRFFYNETLDQCDCFLYGGCGNEALESSWLTNAECNDICHPGNAEEGPRCKLLPKQDIQTFTQASIIKPFDTSSISDTELLDKLNNSNNKG